MNFEPDESSCSRCVFLDKENIANRVAIKKAKSSLEAILRKTNKFVSGNLWTVKRDAQEGLAALSALEEKSK